MGSLNGRIRRLEELIGPAESEDEVAALRHAITRAILDEYAHLKASRAVHYRGGNPPVRIEPEDIPGKILGPGYTSGQLIELAIRRVFEREELPEELVEGWLQMFKEFGKRLGRDWNEVEDLSE